MTTTTTTSTTTNDYNRILVSESDKSGSDKKTSTSDKSDSEEPKDEKEIQSSSGNDQPDSSKSDSRNSGSNQSNNGNSGVENTKENMQKSSASDSSGSSESDNDKSGSNSDSDKPESDKSDLPDKDKTKDTKMKSTSSSSSSSSSTSSTTSKPTDIMNDKMPHCILDKSIVNEFTLPYMQDIGLSILASACSKNRGAFVLDPPDGRTYGCLALPPTMQDRHVSKAEDIVKSYADGNLTAHHAVKDLDFLIERVYASTPNVDLSPYACDINGLVKLDNCPKPPHQIDPDDENLEFPIRAVTIAGVFAPEPWSVKNSSTPSGLTLTQRDAEFYYVKQDFANMTKMGLNTVQFPVAVQFFDTTQESDPTAWMNLLKKWLSFTHMYKMRAIVKLELTQEIKTKAESVLHEAVKQAVDFCNGINLQHNATVVRAVTLPSADPGVIKAAANVGTSIPLWLPAQMGDLTKLQDMATTVKGVTISGISLDLSHTSTIADIASSTAEEDRAKLFYHESMACLQRAPLEYSRCYQNLPIFVGSGFDLAIDDCHIKRIASDSGFQFHDYGQCYRLQSTVHSGWWLRHRQSFAARQISAYEKGGIGWSYATWKVFRVGREKVGAMDAPAKWLALQEVNEMGWFPSLVKSKQSNKTSLSSLELACLNPPDNDFVLGDATLSPTMGPPPDCGNGWWNMTTNQCDYWVPPPFNASECPNTTIIYEECPDTQNITVDGKNVNLDPSGVTNINTHSATHGFFAGILFTTVIAAILYIVFGRHRYQYEEVPRVANMNGYQEYVHHSQNSMTGIADETKPLRAQGRAAV